MLLGRLLSHDRGVIVCCNILDGLEAGMYDQYLVREIFDWWQALSVHTATIDPEKTIYLLRDLAFESVLKNIPPDFRFGIPRPRFSFWIKRRIGNVKVNKSLATVIPAHYLRQKISNDDLRRFENVHGVTFPVVRAEWTSDIIERVQRVSAAKRTFTLRSTEYLHPICLWYTREEDLRSKIDRSAGRPNAARDALGLVHYEEATPLAVLYFSHDELTADADDRPTFTEAADNRRFKARGDSFLSKKRPSWGQTVDLKKIGSGQTILDGCPERIARPVPHGFQLGFDILGVTSGIRGAATGLDSDSAFAEILVTQSSKVSRRTKTEVESRLRSIL